MKHAKHAKLNARQTNALIQSIPFNVLLGVRLARLHPDGITIVCPIKKSLLNSLGSLHGGVSATLADAAVGVAIHRHFGGSRLISTVEMKLNYFRPVREGRIFARSHLLRLGSTLCIGSVDLTDAQSRSVGAALVTYIFLNASKP